MPRSNCGKRLSEEHKRKIGLAGRGRRHTEETKRKISISNTGKIRTEEVRKKMIERLYSYRFKRIGKMRKGPKHNFWIDGRSKDKEYQRMRVRAKRMKRRGYGCIPTKLIQQVYEDNIKKYGTLTCYLCLKPIQFGKDSLEHKTPLSRGGTHLYENLAIACQSCNSKKHIKTHKEYLQEREKNAKEQPVS